MGQLVALRGAGVKGRVSAGQLKPQWCYRGISPSEQRSGYPPDSLRQFAAKEINNTAHSDQKKDSADAVDVNWKRGGVPESLAPHGFTDPSPRSPSGASYPTTDKKIYPHPLFLAIGVPPLRGQGAFVQKKTAARTPEGREAS